MSIFGSIADLHVLRREIDRSARRATGTLEQGVALLGDRVLPMLADLWPWLARQIESRSGFTDRTRKSLRDERGMLGQGVRRIASAARQRPLLTIGLVAAATWLTIRQVQRMRRWPGP